MELDKLFKTQKILDDKIVAEKGLEGQDLLDKKILALQVELGELANEWRGFKFWSANQKPNTGRKIPIECGWCDGVGRDFNHVDCEDCEGSGLSGEYSQTKNYLLEEYVDCLHFILSIGNDIGVNNIQEIPESLVNYTVLDSFENIFYYVARFSELKRSLIYKNFLITFVHLGKRLGFTWNQIEQAYYDKNKVNHERQANGY